MAEYISKDQLTNAILNVMCNRWTMDRCTSSTLETEVNYIIESAINQAQDKLLNDLLNEIEMVEGRELCILCKDSETTN